MDDLWLPDGWPKHANTPPAVGKSSKNVDDLWLSDGQTQARQLRFHRQKIDCLMADPSTPTPLSLPESWPKNWTIYGVLTADPSTTTPFVGCSKLSEPAPTNHVKSPDGKHKSTKQSQGCPFHVPHDLQEPRDYRPPETLVGIYGPNQSRKIMLGVTSGGISGTVL